MLEMRAVRPRDAWMGAGRAVMTPRARTYGSWICWLLQGHKWGKWGASKPNDEGRLRQYRRCRRCDALEGAATWFSYW
jgi:hypothetical protein